MRFQPRKYARAILKHEESAFLAQVKLKGNRSFREFDDKPALRVRFDRKHKDARAFGLRGLVLNNMVDDPTRLRESLGYLLHRAAGVPAPRSTYVQLSIGKENYGLYLALEAIDDSFTRRQTGAEDAALYTADYGCDVYSADAKRMERAHGPRDSRAHLVELAAQADSDRLFGETSLIDWEEVVSFLAVSTYLGDFDGYWHSHNYYLLWDSAVSKWSLVPWGLDRVLFKQLDLFGSRGRLAELCFADADCRRQYLKELEAVVALAESLSLVAVAEGLMTKLRAPLQDSVKDTGSTVEQKQRRIEKQKEKQRELVQFVRARSKEIREALACLQEESCQTNLALSAPCQEVKVGPARFHLCSTLRSWREAKDECERNGMSLATVKTARESKAIYKTASRIDSRRWWIGASDLGHEGRFEWTGGSPLEWDYWASHQPNDNQCGQDCAALHEDGRWFDSHCEQHLPFVCRVSGR